MRTDILYVRYNPNLPQELRYDMTIIPDAANATG